MKGKSWGSINDRDVDLIVPSGLRDVVVMGFLMVKQKLSFAARSGLVLIAFLVMIAPLGGCTKQDTLTAADFVGKWKSTRMITTPVHLYGNSEWEIKSDNGAVMQYGVWQYKDRKILWSYKADDAVIHDKTRVLSVTPDEFRIRERDGSTTTFSRLE